MPIFATTHTGSLPRPADLTQLLQQREDGQAPADFDRRVAQAVRDAVERQVKSGVTIVNDGEMGKIGYSTYVTSRLSGFSRAAEPAQRPVFDVAEFPDLADYRRPVSSAIRYAWSAECTGDIAARDTSAVQVDIANLKTSGEAAGAEQLFMSAACRRRSGTHHNGPSHSTG